MARKPAARRLVVHTVPLVLASSGHSERALERDYVLVNDHLARGGSLDVVENAIQQVVVTLAAAFEGTQTVFRRLVESDRRSGHTLYNL